MAGPAIRAWEIARRLTAEGHRVVLATFGRCERQGEGFVVQHVEVDDFRALVERSEVVVVQGFVVATFPWLQTIDRHLVVDLYDPFHLESLEVDRYKPAKERDANLAFALRELTAQVARGDFFLCASHRQRDLWIGHLAAAGRINPLTYDADPTLASLIRVVPFGTSDVRPERRRHAVKGVVPGIGPDDRVLLWGGGVYNWFDPLTLVRAVDRLRETVPDVRLYFLGMKHPNPDVPEMRVATQCRELSDELGLTGTHVFFNEEWVAYEERADHLLDADVGVSCHYPHVETEFSFRTRILDYLWAGLPIVATDGDAFADLIRAEGLGRVVPAEDVEALRSALEEVLLGDREALTSAVRGVADRMTWTQVLEPLVEYCRAPYRAADADRVHAHATRRPALTPGAAARAVVHHLRVGGVRQLAAKVRWRWQTR
ncbi:glycosyltransferase family 4 protein [Actinotalea ferrariae]|nr:glycosyltransferase family 4 protein [Actinotalea ferrariae]